MTKEPKQLIDKVFQYENVKIGRKEIFRGKTYEFIYYKWNIA